MTPVKEGDKEHGSSIRFDALILHPHHEIIMLVGWTATTDHSEMQMFWDRQNYVGSCKYSLNCRLKLSEILILLI